MNHVFANIMVKLKIKNIILFCFISVCICPVSVAATEQDKSARLLYNREEYKPFEKYNFASVQKLVDKIRQQGHPIPKGHPRIFVNPGNKKRLKTKISKHYRSWFQEAVDLAYVNLNTEITHPGGHFKEPPAQPVVIACGLIYQLGQISGIDYHGVTPEEYGRSGIRHLKSLVKITESKKGPVVNYQHVEYLGLPLGYDWLFEIMDEKDRKSVGKKLLEIAAPDNVCINTWNHPPGARLLGPLAMINDGIDDGKAKKILDMFYNGMVFGDPVKIKPILEGGQNIHFHHIFVPEGPGKEGYGYSVRYGPFYVFLEAWYDQTGEDYFLMPFFQNWVYHAVHITGNDYERQQKSQILKNRSWRRSIGKLVTPMLEVGLARSDRQAASIAKKNHIMRHVSLSVRLVYMLRADPTIKAKTPQELKLPETAHFKIANSVFMRNSWEGTDTTWVWFQSPVWGNHIRGLGSVNDFVIWKNGGFLLTKRHQEHDYDGGSRVNTFVLYDKKKPGKTFIQYNVMDRANNRGGLGIKIRHGGSIQKLSKEMIGYTKGLRYLDHLPGKYSYMSGDGEKSFTDKRLKKWNRQLIWFRPDKKNGTDHFVLLDRIEKNSKTVQEHLMFNFNKNPEIMDRIQNTSRNSGALERPGIWVYTRGNRIIAENDVKTGWGKAHGKIFIDTLLPKYPIYYRMGGIGTRNVDLFGNLRQAKLPRGLINGSEDSAQNILNGMWRVQITGSKNRINQMYLHTLQAEDIKKTNPEPTMLLRGESIIGAGSGNKIALFSNDEAFIPGNSSLVFPEKVKGNYDILIVGLKTNQSTSVFMNDECKTCKDSDTKSTKAGTLYLEDIPLHAGDKLKILYKDTEL